MQVLTLVLLSAESMGLPSLLGDHQHNDHQDNAADEDYYDENADRSYKFGFEADDQSRQEEADQDGLVMGKYTYVDANGVERSLSYRAGANLGFVIDDTSFGQKISSPVKPVMPTVYTAPALPLPTTLYQAPIAPVLVQPQVLVTTYELPQVPVTLYEAPKPPATLYETPKIPMTLYEAPKPPAKIGRAHV